MDNEMNKNLPQAQEKATTPEEKDMINNFLTDISRMFWEHERIIPNPVEEENHNYKRTSW